ncbi:hypothetical protein WJX84_003599 [Apatococcus fuscideae]|uniref:Prephenate/arogenate dehydrogenase domain-containing protein n=1 Tax=Apatococcus fuscideae TaxID=2026836 RepID=A0AAW1T5J3_9CHLO
MAYGPIVRTSKPPQTGSTVGHFCSHSFQRQLSSLRPSPYLCRSGLAGRFSAARGSLQINALDAAMPFDFESRATSRMKESKQLTVGIVGFGTFGQFLAKRLVQAGHKVLATSRTNYQSEAKEIGVSFFRDADDFCEEHPDVVILACAILALEKVVGTLPLQRLRRSTLMVDVLSVKQFPKQLLLSLLPPEMDVLCTHPMFGPDSGKGSWGGLNFMYDKVRIGPGSRRQARIDCFLQFFAEQGCRMVDMSCEEHDRLAAGTQFITHTVGRVLGR